MEKEENKTYCISSSSCMKFTLLRAGEIQTMVINYDAKCDKTYVKKTQQDETCVVTHREILSWWGDLLEKKATKEKQSVNT